MEKERNRIRTEERTRIAAKLVSSVANQLLNDLKESGSSEQSSSNKKNMPNKDAKKPHKSYPKNNQRGSQSLSNLSNTSETKYSANSGAKPKPKNFQKTSTAPQRSTWKQSTASAPPNSNYRKSPSAPPMATCRAPPSAPPNAPPSYEQSVHQQVPYSVPPLFSTAPPLLNNPYVMQGYSQNYQMPGAGYHVPQPPPYSNYPRPARPFHTQEKFQYKGQQKSFSGTGPISQKPQQAPKPTPRTSIQNKSGNTDSSFDKDDKKNIDVNVVVRKLSECDRYFSFLKSLSQKLEMNSSDLLKIVKEESEVFSNIYDSNKKDSVIELCPKIELCKDHQEKGCIVKDCFKIHLCEDFIFSNCTRKDCPLGHLSNFKSNHNVNILKKYYLSILPNATLQQLFQKVCNRSVPPKICFDYHLGICQFADNCTNIHICDSYVNNLGLCSNDNCSLSHNIRDPKIVATFKALGISTNESPRDLLKVLKDMSIEKEKKDVGNKDLSKINFVSDGKENWQINPLGKDTKKDKPQNTKETKKSVGANQQTENTTSFCTNFHGSVKIPKVCMDGMKQKCKFIRNSCHYLHCRHKSHWQFGNDNKWYNFHLYHSQILDSKFSDPNCEDVDLPKLDYSRLNPTQRDLITVLGKKSLKVDFKKMTLYCESVDKTYSLRNLTTNSSVLGNNDDLENYTVFKWYFEDDDGQYKLYDNNDSSSFNIEKAYVIDPNSITKFNSANFSYSIDFIKMTQENESTNKIRSLKRRPFILRDEKINDTNKTETEEKIQLPKTWDDKKSKSLKKVKLNPSDEEYMDLRQILFLSLPQINIINIWRIQNVFLWQKFTNKKTVLEKQYNDSFLNVQKLFHGIDSDSVDDIVRENFEFRRHSITSSRPYGEGTYFYNSASAGASNCSPDSNGKKILLIAEVIIGKVAQGSPGLTRPPENPVYNCMYDTTTDNIQTPSVYVKYSTLEYYPAYIVEFI